MRSKFGLFKARSIELRRTGKTYGEIRNIIGQDIPKSTLSLWCNSIYLSSEQRRRIDRKVKKNCEKGRIVAWEVNKKRRQEYLKSVHDRVNHLATLLDNKDNAKMVLAALYLGEGSKRNLSYLMFGNSDPNIISLFLKLLRFCYNIDENKFRCTIQCRFDQDIPKLEKFWSNITNISMNQFYKTRIDPRTIGKKSKRLDYKGVCRIDYFSADIFTELMEAGRILYSN